MLDPSKGDFFYVPVMFYCLNDQAMALANKGHPPPPPTPSGKPECRPVCMREKEVKSGSHVIQVEVQSQPCNAAFSSWPLCSHRSDPAWVCSAAQSSHAVVEHIRRKLPYWDRNQGRDHMFIFTRDHGCAG